MNSNQKKFSVYIFLSTFARNLIELFIPIILYKYGYSLKEVILYYLFVNIFSVLITHPIIKMSKKYSNKILVIIGFISFFILQILLNNLKYNVYYLIILAFLFALYRRGYWISRRFYNLKIMKKEKISSTYSLISIFNQIAVIISSYIGAILLDFFTINLLNILSMIIYVISMIPLFLLKFNYEKNNIKLDFIGTIKKIPKQNLYLFGSYELINVLKFLFPLYLFIYVKDTYQVVGIINVITNLSIIIFAYFYGKKLDGNKNYLKLSIILTVIVYFLKANSTFYLLIIISFLEGIFTKMYELSISKEFYVLSKQFEYYNYNYIYEFIQNIFRTIVVLVLFLFGNNLKSMIYIVLLFIILGALFNFKQVKYKNDKFN